MLLMIDCLGKNILKRKNRRVKGLSDGKSFIWLLNQKSTHLIVDALSSLHQGKE